MEKIEIINRPSPDIRNCRKRFLIPAKHRVGRSTVATDNTYEATPCMLKQRDAPPNGWKVGYDRFLRVMGQIQTDAVHLV
jgi:hypothetical protein